MQKKSRVLCPLWGRFALGLLVAGSLWGGRVCAADMKNPQDNQKVEVYVGSTAGGDAAGAGSSAAWFDRRLSEKNWQSPSKIQDGGGQEKTGAAAAGGDATEDRRLAEGNWRSPSKDRPSGEDAQASAPEEGGGSSLGVRMTFLPAANVDPAPGIERASSWRRGHAYAREQRALQKKKKLDPQAVQQEKDEAGACAALDAYKKRQLDAIQRDKETLEALQEAIRSLGLSRQMSFMSEQDGTLAASDGAAVTPQPAAPSIH